MISASYHIGERVYSPEEWHTLSSQIFQVYCHICDFPTSRLIAAIPDGGPEVICFGTESASMGAVAVYLLPSTYWETSVDVWAADLRRALEEGLEGQSKEVSFRTLALDLLSKVLPTVVDLAAKGGIKITFENLPSWMWLLSRHILGSDDEGVDALRILYEFPQCSALRSHQLFTYVLPTLCATDVLHMEADFPFVISASSAFHGEGDSGRFHLDDGLLKELLVSAVKVLCEMGEESVIPLASLSAYLHTNKYTGPYEEADIVGFIENTPPEGALFMAHWRHQLPGTIENLRRWASLKEQDPTENPHD